MAQQPTDKIKGRGAQLRPANRFESTSFEPDLEAIAKRSPDEPSVVYDLQSRAVLDDQQPRLETQYLADETRSIIAENESPDVGFRYSVNPYRGCEHGCAYCYARPSHEFLGFDAGLDFESRILVKHRAPELLRKVLSKSGWQGQVIAFSGNTDCYQPAERRFELTRRCLQVALEARQPVGIVTKNALVLRDLDVLQEMARQRLVHVNVSVTSLDAQLARTLEPRTSSPKTRLNAIIQLNTAGIPVRVLVAPIIPGLTDHETPSILKASSEAGAGSAAYVLLRLPLAVEPIFRDWLEKNVPLKQARIEALVKSTRAGRFYNAQWGSRMRGEGCYAEQIANNFKVFAKKYGLDRPLEPALDASQFRAPSSPDGQRRLF